MALAIDPLTPAFGAEIHGAKLIGLDDTQFTELFRVFTAYGVVFLRDQPVLSPEQLMAFARKFGEIHLGPSYRQKSAEYPGLLRMRTNKDSRVVAGNRWHSDGSYDALAPQASILQLHKIPPVGGDTLFASLCAAYTALSDRTKVMLDGLTALHSAEESYRRFGTNESGAWPENNHPIVRKHVDSGRPVLYLDRAYTKSINDLPKDEGKALLEFLLDHAERVDFQCRFRWSENAIAIWDNRCALHHVLWDYWPQDREGHRISVVGETPVSWRLGVDEIPRQDSSMVRLTV